MRGSKDKEFNETLKRMMDSKPKPHEEVKDDAREKREAERRRKMNESD